MKILAVASSGGHWTQLCRLAEAFEGHEVVYVTVNRGHREEVAPARFYSVPDANRDTKLKLIWLAARLVWIVLRERPQIAVSTGAAPGYLALRLAKYWGAKVVWIDSIANAERLSLSGELIGRHSELWLTQWPQLAQPEGPEYGGTIF